MTMIALLSSHVSHAIIGLRPIAAMPEATPRVQICQKPGTVAEEKMDTAVELFEREELASGKAILTEGETCSRLYIVRGGSVNATGPGGEKATLREAGGFIFFGDDAMMVRR